jgi:endonuclease YncB( thermonuclease family)
LVAAIAFAFGLTIGTTMDYLMAERSIAAVAMPSTTEAQPAPAPSRGGYPAEVLRISDGDTFEARVHVWPGIAITTLVRLRGIDTPELKARCSEERRKAEAARQALGAILAEGSVELSGVGLDKFGGRTDATASTPSTPDISAALLRAGMARSYAGGRRESWCS